MLQSILQYRRYFYAILLLFGILLLKENALAQVICEHVDNCESRNVALDIIPIIGSLLLAIAGGAAVLFIVVGGAMMVLSFGDDNYTTKGRNAVIYSLVGLLVALTSQVIVSFIVTKTQPLSNAPNPVLAFMAVVVDAVLSILNVVVIILIMIAGLRYIIAAGKTDQTDKAGTMLLWAVIGVVIINAAHALVQALIATIG